MGGMEPTPINETRGITAHHPCLNAGVAGFSASAYEWSGLATVDVETKTLSRAGKTDQRPEAIDRIFPFTADHIAGISRDSHCVLWMIHELKEVPGSELPDVRFRLPFKPNGAWKTIATTSLDYDAWGAAPSPDGKHLAVLSPLGTIDILAWGESSPTGCLPTAQNPEAICTLYWKDKDTLIAEYGVGSRTYHLSKDLLRPVTRNQKGDFLGVTEDGKPHLVPARTKNESLMADGYNHVITREGRHRAAWLPGISSDWWCEIPERNLVAYYSNGLWISDVVTGQIVHGFAAPYPNGVAASKENVFTRSQNGSIFRWVLPPR